MKLKRILGSCVPAAAFFLLVASFEPPHCHAQTSDAELDKAFIRFHDETDSSKRHRAAKAIVALGSRVGELERRLAVGRIYSNDAKRGRVRLSLKDDEGHRHHTLALVPSRYDAARPIEVRFILHGGVERPRAWSRNDQWWRRLDPFEEQDYIAVFPSSWKDSLWWSQDQVANFRGILMELKRDYNLDENRVSLFGVSDGGTGAYYHAMKAPTPWAAVLPFIGHPAVLDNPGSGIVDAMFSANLAATPLYIVNGKTDRLYPAHRVTPYVRAFERLGARVVYRIMEGGHNTRWWSDEAESIAAFLQDHPRDPFPERMVWQMDEDLRFGRLHWLVVDAVSPRRDSTLQDDSFPTNEGSARIELHKKGNRVEVTAVGVDRYRLLIGSGQFDLKEPIEVLTNGAPSFVGRVAPSAETLLYWASRDDDRTQLFVAEIPIDLGTSE